jgi:hypothetical protein
VGQPDHSVDAGIVYFPYTGQEVIRSNLHLLNISDEAYRRYFSRRHDLRSPLRSTWTDLRDVAGDLEVDFERSVFDEEDGSFRLRAPLADIEEVPPALDPRARRRAAIEKSDRVLRSHVTANAASVRSDGEQSAPVGSEFWDGRKFLTMSAMAANASKLTVTKALNSEDKSEWETAIRDRRRGYGSM